MTVRRLLPSTEIHDVNPFVFLDHMGPMTQQPAPQLMGGTGAHPHRGFITFTYLFSGEVEHSDSRGHRGTVGAGGVQWMLAGSGIIHDEKPSAAFQRTGGVLHGLQLWINVPASHKNDTPLYKPLSANEVPETDLPDNAGRLRVLLGEYNDLVAPIPTFSPMAVYHIKLLPNAAVNIPIPASQRACVFIPSGRLQIGSASLTNTELGLLDQSAEAVTLQNRQDTVQDVVLYRAEPIAEPMVAQGPFVMNTDAEIKQAYSDFNAGKYGVIPA